MKKKLFAGATLFFVFLGLVFVSADETTVSFSSSDVTINAEIASTSSERQQGLMHRESLGENQGMLFIYDEEDYRSFWMKNTLIPLDMIFITSDYRITNIEKAEPEPGVADADLQRYSSEEPVKYVLEVNQNFSERNNIEKGDTVEIGSTRFLSLDRFLQ